MFHKNSPLSLNFLFPVHTASFDVSTEQQHHTTQYSDDGELFQKFDEKKKNFNSLHTLFFSLFNVSQLVTFNLNYRADRHRWRRCRLLIFFSLEFPTFFFSRFSLSASFGKDPNSVEFSSLWNFIQHTSGINSPKIFLLCARRFTVLCDF